MTDQGFETAFEQMGKLASTFQANEDRYLSPDYQEAEARKDFIDKFFTALGWDVNHDVQTNPYAQEVKVERTHGASQRRADYGFFLAPNFRDVRFYVEAKKPSREVATPEYYFQTIRYGSSSRTPLAIITDFEQFHILDCRFKAELKSALKRCVRRYHYRDYTDREKFAEIYWLFSREAVASGALEKLAATLPKRGKDIPPPHLQNIDDAFLDELEGYRATLAHTFKQKNPRLDSETLTEVTQRTLDRLVFMRFLEDKLIEPQPMVVRFAAKDSAWPDFIAASRRLNGIYNGIVFKEHAVLDSLSFRADNEVFADICRRLSDEHSPYDFDAIPIHILGSIYERFLGKVIVATDKRVRVEDKPEVRKAGGVYYTPEYIVRYIVENTVGKLIDGKTPEQIAKMRFADIACGSGSFLLGIYDLLLNYHGTYYNQNPAKARKADCIERDGKLFLSLLKKREILLNNIYGVDIDSQAVEVCQLSLYLRLLKDETTATARQSLLDFAHAAQMKRLLPDLSKNIVCGNSLIGTDILEGKLFSTDEERKLNPMNFEDAFPEVMRKGGFDAVVGNPPWGAEFKETEKLYLLEHFPRVPSKTKDSYFYFICRGIDILKDDGSLGFIVPNSWLLINYAKDFRKYLLAFHLSQVIEHGDGVFAQATVESATFLLAKAQKPGGTCRAVRYRKGELIVDHQLDKRIWLDDEFARIVVDIDPDTSNLLAKLRHAAKPFGDNCVIIWGIKPYQVGYGIPPQTREMVDKRVYHSDKMRGKDWKPILVGSGVNRYVLNFPGNLFIRYGKWLMYPSNEELMLGPKILMRQTSDILRCCFDDNGYYCQNSVFIVHSSTLDLKYMLALLNSRLLGFVYKCGNPQTGKVFAEIKPSVIKELPIRRINFSDSADKACHDEIVQKVEEMLDAKKQLAKAKTDKDKTYYENKCAALDRQIDRLVYDLYDLTEDEIRIVEEGAK